MPGAGQPKRETLAYTDRGAAGVGAELAAKGTARLSPAQLSDLVALELKLARKSPRLCAGFWSGGITLQDMATTIEAEFTDAEARRWFEPSIAATRLELHAKGPPARIRGEDVGHGIQLMLDALAPVERDPLLNTLDMGVKAPPEAEAQEWLGPFAEHIGTPFCDAANRNGREARVYMTVGTGDEQQARRWNCELGKWGEWFANVPRPVQAPPTQTIADAVRACNNVQANRDVPVSCRTDNVDGVPSMIVGFPTAADAEAYMLQVDEQVAGPFCDAANRASVPPPCPRSRPAPPSARGDPALPRKRVVRLPGRERSHSARTRSVVFQGIAPKFR